MWDVLYDLLFQPGLAMRNIGEQKRVGQAWGVALTSIIIPVWALALSSKDNTVVTAIHMLLGFKVVVSLFMWMTAAASWHLIAEFLGGRGTGIGLFTALGFAYLPCIFIIPLWAIITVMPPSSKTLLMTIAILGILFWSLLLDVLAIREVHQLSTAKAVLTMIMPIILIGVLAIIGFVFISSSIIQMPVWL